VFVLRSTPSHTPLNIGVQFLAMLDLGASTLSVPKVIFQATHVVCFEEFIHLDHRWAQYKCEEMFDP
jgi:hypothetical protein